MGSLQALSHALIHWSFGVTILVGLVASDFSGAETVVAVIVAAFTSTLSAICSCVSKNSADYQPHRKKRLNSVLYFLVIWLDILTNLVAASACARLASATVDYISKGHFREFLFGLQQYSLGEPWPDVLGVTIVIAVTAMFMLGLEVFVGDARNPKKTYQNHVSSQQRNIETTLQIQSSQPAHLTKSSTISSLLFIALFCNFIFFTAIGSFHTMMKFSKWCQDFKVHSFRTVLKAASVCSFAFVHSMPTTEKNNCLKVLTLVFNPLIFYIVIAVVFSLMTDYRELVGTAIPLVQVFENRDVDWARPLIAVFTISVVCLLLTEILPYVYFAFVKLASKEWQVFVSSIQYQSNVTGAPVLAIFAAGSLAAILSFACPLSHLIKLLNTSSLLKCAIISCQIVYDRYKPEITINDNSGCNNTNVQYKKLKQNSSQTSSSAQSKNSIKDKIKSFFGNKAGYIHRLSSPKSSSSLRCVKEERECLLMDDYSNKSVPNVNIQENSESENEVNELEVLSCSDDSDSSTDIDIIVEEYREGLKVATVGNFKKSKRPSTRLSASIVVVSLALIVFASINVSLYIHRLIDIYWPGILAIVVCMILIGFMPQNSADKSKEMMLPSLLFPLCHTMSIVFNIVLASTIIEEVWQGIVFWTIAGLLLYLRCDCCNTKYNTLHQVNKSSSHMKKSTSESVIITDNITDHISVPEKLFITR